MYAVVIKQTDVSPAERARRLAAAYSLVLERFGTYASRRLAEIDDQLARLAGDPAAWRERLALRREKRYLLRLLGGTNNVG